MARRSARPAARTELFRKAFAFYAQAYELSGDSFPGINAATLALLAGRPSSKKKPATTA